MILNAKLPARKSIIMAMSWLFQIVGFVLFNFLRKNQLIF